MLAEHVLQLLRGGDECLASLPELGGRELRRVAGPFRAEPPCVEIRVARRAVEPDEGLSGSPPLRPPDVAERRLRVPCLGLRRVFQAIEKREIPIARERGDDGDARLCTLGVERAEQVGGSCPIVAQTGDVRFQPLGEHVEVSRRAERLPEPAELVAKRLGPCRGE